MNEKTIHTGRNVRKSGLAAKQHSSTVCAAYGGMIGSVKNKFFTRQVCAASIANIGALAARKRRLAA